MAARVRAFIIDDDPGIRSFLSMLMKRRGYEIIEYARATPCAACRHEPGTTCTDLILSDVRMPGMNGIEFVGNQTQVGCKVRNFALMSGQWTEEDLLRVRQLGGHVLRKPFPLADLENWLDQCERSIDPDRVLSDEVPRGD